MKTKEKIAKIGLKLFLQKGFYNVSMQDIAKEVGISKPAIYHHFKNKDHMIEGILDFFTKKTKLFMKGYYSNSDNYKNFLKSYFNITPVFKNIEKILLDNEQCETKHNFNEFLISISRYNPVFKKRIAKDIVGAMKKKEEMNKKAMKKGLIKDNIDSRTLALMIHAIVEGLSFIYEIIPDDNMEENIEKIYELFWNLIKTNKGDNNE